MANKDQKVWIGQCISTIIFSIICFLTVLIPYKISGGVEYTLTFIPIIGNNTITSNQLSLTANFLDGIRLSSNIFSFIFSNNVLIFYSVLVFNVVFSLILIITRLNVLRIIAKIIAIISAITLIVITLSYIFIIVSIFYALFSGYYPISEFFPSLLTSGVIYYFVTLFFIIALIRKEFTTFSKRTW